MRAKGWFLPRKVLDFRVTREEDAAVKLGLDAHAPVIHSPAPALCGREPMVFVETYLSYQKYGLCFRENLEENSLYAVLDKCYQEAVHKVSRILHGSWQTARWHACCISTAAPRFTPSPRPLSQKPGSRWPYSIAKYRGTATNSGGSVSNNLLSLKKKVRQKKFYDGGFFPL